MKENTKNIIFIIIGVFVILIIIFAQSRISRLSEKNRWKEIESLNAKIDSLRDSIKWYNVEIERLEKEKHKKDEVIKYIDVERDKKDISIINGDVDYNIGFITDYLSKKDGYFEGHNSCNYPRAVESNK